MRKPRDIDAELKALADKQRSLKSRKVTQLGELVVATGADVLDIETLAGALVDAAARPKADPAREAWRTSGAAFFRRERRAKVGAVGDGSVAQANGGGA